MIHRRTVQVIIMLLLISGIISGSCHSRKDLCNSKSYHKTYNTKKNRNRYNQKYSNKGKTVKKDYVIRNGIAR
jgi:hypothetical protein